MKIILTGATGLIGGEVLIQALAHSAITSLVCITRKPLPESVASNPKLKVILRSDFTTYPSDILAELQGSQACIWALGSPARKTPDLELCRSIEIGYSSAAANAFQEALAPQMKPFRFLYLSGMLAEREKGKKLWFLHDSRTIKGEAETGVLAIQKESSNFEVSIVRPGGVFAKGNITPNTLVSVLPYIKVEELAAAMIEEVVGDVEGTRTLENEELRSIGRRVLKSV